jgi:[protein-PII] uridylyltransferase
VSGRDRPGLLAELARVLTQARVSVVSAHIDSYGERVGDTFYVKTADGKKLENAAEIEALRETLIAVLREGEPEAPTSIGSQRLAVAPASQLR